MRKICLALCLALAALYAHAQNVGIGTNTPDNSARLQIDSDTKGLLIPRMDSNARKAISMPAAGLMVYDSTYKALFINTGTAETPAWQPALSPSSGWSLYGNMGTDTTMHALGTMDNMPLFLKSHGMTIARFFPNRSSYYLGHNSGLSPLTTFNTAYGHQTLSNNSSGVDNTVMGYRALVNNRAGSRNAIFGARAGDGIVRAFDNTAIGNSALGFNDSANANTAIGANALGNLRSSTSTGNIGVGYASLSATQFGSYNMALGYRADTRTPTQPVWNWSNATAIGAFSLANCDNCIVLGSVAGANNAISSVNVGIGVHSPASALHIAKSLVNAGTNDLLLLENLDNGGAGIRFKNPAVPAGLWQTYVEQDGKFKIGRDMIADNITISLDGSVGINNNNPSFPLDVNGAVRVSGGVYTYGPTYVQDILHAANDVQVDGSVNVGYDVNVTGNINVTGSIQQNAVVAPTLVGGWTVYGGGFAAPGYYIDKEKRVHLHGLIRNTASPVGNLFTLPDGYRPAAAHIFLVPSSAPSGFSRIDVNPSGLVMVNTGAGPLPAPGGGYVALDGISFRVN